jgi:phage shock protein PspC (stress-responsive transcriptional regulator)
MITIITIHIGGTIHMVDEEAFDALRRYLDQARARLRANPDQAEILGDLERSIGDKLSRRAGAGTAATRADVLAILHEIGPVDADVDAPPQPPPSAAREPRRLYRIHEGEQIAGVCTGLAAYADLDVTLVRVIFILLTILTGGLLAIVYLVMMFALPVARPAEARTPATARP